MIVRFWPTGGGPGAVVPQTVQVSGTAAGTSSDTALQGAPSALHPNEPAGAVAIYNNPGTFELGGMWYDNSYNAAVEVVSDAGNPTGSGQAIRRTHSGSSAGAAKLDSWSQLGATLGGQGRSDVGYEELYLSLRKAYESGQNPCATHDEPVGADNPGFKHFYMGMDAAAKQGAGANEIYLTACSGQEFAIQRGNGQPTQSEFTSDLGWGDQSAGVTWHLELHLIAESANGAGDGVAHIYINGTLVHTYTNRTFSDPTKTGRLFDGMEMYHTADPPLSGTHAWLEREWYVSGIPAAA